VISPDQVTRLHDQLETFTAAIVVGCLFFFVGGTLGIFASQEFADGTDFMQRLAGAEQILGFVLIVVGWIRVRSINAEFDRHAADAGASRAFVAGAGH
jgi:hypothetical protein